MSLPTIDFRKFTVDDIKECLENSGYTYQRYEFDFARDDGAFKYLGYSDHQYRFLIGFEADEEEKYLVSIVWIGLGMNGNLVGEFSGCPVYEGDYEGALEYIEKRCN